MNIEENIKPLKILMSKYKQIDEMNNFDHELALVIDYKELSAIETLLTAYEKEKDKNKTLEELLQGRLFELYKYYKDLASKYQGNCVSKDKIKEIIYPTPENPMPIEIQQSEMYKKLLKEMEE